MMRSLYLERYDAYISYYTIKRSGIPILFLPGLITPSLPLFFDIIHDLRFAERSIILVDYIGAGGSDSIPDFEHSMEAHASMITEILKHEKITKINIMGHSMGGTVGAYIAHQLEQIDISVHMLVMSEANLFAGGGPGTQSIANESEDNWVQYGHDALLEKWKQGANTGSFNDASNYALWRSVDPVAIHRASVNLVNLPNTFFPMLQKLACTKHFIYGELNVPNTLDESWPDTPLRKSLEDVGISTHVIPSSGHMMMLDNLEGYTNVLANIFSNADR